MKSRIGVVSDLHCGSIFGLLPPDFRSANEAVIKQNPGQAYLWECWLHAAKWMGAVDALVINGDIIDGPQPAQRAKECCLTMMQDQGRAAKETVDPLIKETKPNKIYVIQGSEYHDDKSGEAAEGFAEAVGACAYSGLGTGRFSREVLDLEIDGVIINFAHGISTSVGFYRATALDREGIFSALAGKEAKMPKADCVIRSHAHNFVHVEHESKHIAISPCWQLQTRFMRKNSVYRMLPSIGSLLIEIDSDAKRNDEDPITIRKKVYKLPKVRTVKL
jgi:hypothetical protein